MSRPRQVTDQQIIEGARECFLAMGPSVSTTVIAKRVGLSQAALFKRFGTKDDLMLAALSPTPDAGLLARIASGPTEGEDLDVALRALLHDMAQHIRKMMPCVAVLRASGVSPQRILAQYEEPPPLAVHGALVSWMETARRNGSVREVDPSTAAMAMMGAVHVRSFLAHLLCRDFGSFDGYLDDLADLLSRGLRPEEGA